jgi:hypothetical protein
VHPSSYIEPWPATRYRLQLHPTCLKTEGPLSKKTPRSLRHNDETDAMGWERGHLLQKLGTRLANTCHPLCVQYWDQHCCTLSKLPALALLDQSSCPRGMPDAELLRIMRKLTDAEPWQIWDLHNILDRHSCNFVSRCRLGRSKGMQRALAQSQESKSQRSGQGTNLANVYYHITIKDDTRAGYPA